MGGGGLLVGVRGRQAGECAGGVVRWGEAKAVDGEGRGWDPATALDLRR